MEKSNILIKENVIVILRNKKQLRHQILLLVLLVLSISYPLYYGLIAYSDEGEISFRMIALLVVGFSIAYFAFRFLLWHVFGKEVLILNEDKIEYFADYGLFQGNKKQLFVDPENATFGIRINVFEDDKIPGKKKDAEEVLEELSKEAAFNEDNKVVETMLTVSKSDMEKIQDKFFEVYKGVF